MTTPRQQEIVDAAIDAIAFHGSENCTHETNQCPPMNRLAVALGDAIDGRPFEEQLDVVTFLLERLLATAKSNARTHSEDHGHPAAAMTAFQIGESGGLLAGMLYTALAGGRQDLDDAARLIIRTLGESAVFRTVAAIMPVLVQALALRAKQMGAPLGGSR